MRSTFTGAMSSEPKLKPRPKTSISKRTIDIYAEATPLHKRIRRAYHQSSLSHLQTPTNPLEPFTSPKDKVDSDQP